MSRFALAFFVVLLSCPTLAGAQDATVAASPAEPPPSPEEAEAMERYADAEALFARGDQAGALAEMERIRQLLDGSPRAYVILYNLGRVYEELFRYDRALELYQRYLAESPPDSANRAEAEASLRALERLLGTIVIRTNAEGAHVWMGDAEVGTAPGELRVSSGHQVIELRADGYESVRREIDVIARQRLELDLPMARLSDVHGLDPAIFIGTTVAAAAVLIAGVAIGVTALATSGDADGCVDRPGCSIDVPATRRTVRDEALAADVLYGTAGAIAISAVVLALFTDWGSHPSTTAARVTPTLGGLVVSGAF
jgi:tetratricopeptide (TPR) repeat protein